MLLLDNSAWTYLLREAVPADRAETIAGWMEEGLLVTCLPFLLEAGYSAQSGADHSALMDELERLPRVKITPHIERLAFKAQGELARIGHHRLAPADVVVAACAHASGAGVLHYDRDYDILAERTSLSFNSEWLAAPGSL